MQGASVIAADTGLNPHLRLEWFGNQGLIYGAIVKATFFILPVSSSAVVLAKHKCNRKKRNVEI